MDRYPPIDVGFISIGAGSLLMVLGLFGFSVNINNIVNLLSMKDRHTAFGQLCIARGIYNLMNLNLFVSYVGPNTAFQLLPAYDEIGRVICFFASFTYLAMPLVQFGITYNRMTALLFPLKYERICPVEAAWFFIGVGVAFGLYWIIHMLVFNCRYVYNAKMMSWKYVNCDYMDKKLNFIYPVLIMTGTVLVLNTMVATALILRRRSVAAHHHHKKNLRMFWQSFVQDLFNCHDCIWQCFLSPLVDSRIWVFWADTIVWELSPICDGTVAMLFDVRLRKPFWSRERQKREQTRSIFVSGVTSKSSKSTHR